MPAAYVFMLQGFRHRALNRSRFNDSEAFTPCYSGAISLKVSSHINRAQEGLTERLDGHSQPYAPRHMKAGLLF